MLNKEDKLKILSEFPNLKLSYENLIHKKVCNFDEYVVAIPSGKKSFAWFTYYKDKEVCLQLDLEETNKISNIQILNGSFNSQLCIGTILYGTNFNYIKNNVFSIEDILFYKGKDISHYTWIKKLALIEELMKYNVKQIAYNSYFTIFGLPLMNNSYEGLLKDMDNIKYKIDRIQFRCFHKKNTLNYLNYQKETVVEKNPNPRQSINNNFDNRYNNSNNNSYGNNYSDYANNNYANNKYYIKEKRFGNNNDYKNKTTLPLNKNNKRVFIIKPDLQNDIYHLYYLDDNKKETYYDIAYIPNYTTSVMMNILFRNIKENYNLDALEESDEEEEFENEKEDKYVFLDKTFPMECCYNTKFKKWYPIKVDNINKVVCKKDLAQL